MEGMCGGGCVRGMCVEGMCERGELYHSVEGRGMCACEEVWRWGRCIFTIVQRGTCPFPSQQRERETRALWGSVERGRGVEESAELSCGRRRR